MAVDATEQRHLNQIGPTWDEFAESATHSNNILVELELTFVFIRK